MKLNHLDRNNIKYCIILCLLVGYPKIPLLEVPMAMLLIIFTPSFIISTFKKKIYTPQILISFLFLAYYAARLSIESASTLRDFSFTLTLTYKILTSVLIAEVFFKLLNGSTKLIYTFITLQLAIISASALNQDIYNLLLLFQTNALTNTFTEIFGLRSLGFGVIHNEGAAFLALMYAFLLFKSSTSAWISLLSLLIYLTTLTSRMSMILISICQVLLSPSKLIISLTIITVLAVFFIDTSAGILSEVFEIYNNFLTNGTISLRSTDAMSEMSRYPDNITTWIVGDGKFFSNYGFYMDTDLGFSRMLFSGGLIGLLLYLLSNMWPLFYINYEKKIRFYILALCILICFTIINTKGINIQNWAFITLLLISKTHSHIKT